MRTSKNRSSLNTSADTSFRWQQCSQCLKSIPSSSEHQCSDECNGIFVEHDRARLLVHEHKAEYFKDLVLPSFIHHDLVFIAPETMRLLVNVCRNDHVLLISTTITKDQQRFWRLGLLWPNAMLAENHLALSRTILDHLQEQQSIELRTIPKDRIQDTTNIILSAVVPSPSRSANERRLISTCLKYQLANRIVYAEQCVDFVYLGQPIRFCVKIDLIDSLNCLSLDSDSTHFYRISPSNTVIDIQFEEPLNDKKNIADNHLSLSDIGGLQKEKIELAELLLSPSNAMSPRGILLHGPKGCGKTMLINALADQAAAIIVRINPSEVYSRHYGESENKLKGLFTQTTTATNGKKCLIIVENIESLCPNQERVTQHFERRLTTTFVELLDRYLDGNRVILIATTNRLDSVDADLRRPGRIDEEIEIVVPNQYDRREILNIKLRTMPNDMTEEQLQLLADRTHGFTGCDLGNLCRKANHIARKSPLTYDHFENALTIVRPSSMREVILEVPKVKWSDIGGQHQLKQRLEEMVVWPLKHASALDRLNVQVPKGILMYGPPGCSKTMVAKAVATESGLNFLAVKGPELFSKWVGESERAVRELFRRARLAAPAIIFFDEIDAIANSRSSSSSSQSNVSDRVIATLLIEMDGIEKLKGVTIIAATNRPDCIDPALMRPGRFDRLVYVPLPDEETRFEIFQIRFRHSPIHQNVQIQRLVELTQGYSGAEIAAICDEAALVALRDNIEAPHIEWQHFERALMSIKPRTSDEHVRKLDAFTRQHGK